MQGYPFINQATAKFPTIFMPILIRFARKVWTPNPGVMISF